VLRHDAQLVARHRSESEARASRDCAREQARCAAKPSSKAARALARIRGRARQKRSLASRLHADRTRERAALVELEKAARALEETLASLGAEPQSPNAPRGGVGFAALKGRLAAPVPGRVAQSFGRVVDAEFGTQTFRAGVVFDAALGTSVRAIAPGLVRFAGWFRGYGRLVILDHGDRYFTVSGHLGELAVKVGDVIAVGQEIGSVGDTGSLAGARLYFEIRLGSQPLDPGDWLVSLGSG
jgi:septal ring factor EnvC (AmiA/AmiB activator)